MCPCGTPPAGHITSANFVRKGTKLMKVFDKITSILSRAIDLLTFVGYAVVLVVLFIQVVARYVFDYGIVWTDEFSRYTMVWLVMLCAASLVRDKAHIRVTFLETVLPVRFHKWIDLFMHLMIILFSVVVFRYSLTTLSFATKAVSTNMRIPMTAVYSAFPVSMAVMFLNAVFNSLSILFKRKATDIDKEEMVE